MLKSPLVSITFAALTNDSHHEKIDFPRGLGPVLTCYGFCGAGIQDHVTVVESIVPGGVGRSRIIEATTSEADSEAATTESVWMVKKSGQGDVKRGDLQDRWLSKRPSW